MHTGASGALTSLCAILATAAAVQGASQPDQASPPVVYVDLHQPEGGDGSTWQHAFNKLQDALNVVNQFDQGSIDVRIAAGKYKPPQFRSFTLQPPSINSAATLEFAPIVRLMGGFAGATSSQPDSVVGHSVFNGDMLDNDTSDPSSHSDNSFVVLDVYLPNHWTLEMHTIDIVQGGNSSNSEGPSCGMYVNAEYNAGLVLNNCTFNDNLGGGLRSYRVPVYATGCAWNRNSAPGRSGGGVYVSPSFATNGGISTFSYSTFNNNSADAGGAIFLEDAESLLNLNSCTLVGNECLSRGGAASSSGIFAGSSFFLHNGCANATGDALGGALAGANVRVVSSRFYGNSAVSSQGDSLGGAVYATDQVLLVSTALSGNVASSSQISAGGAVLSEDKLTVTFCTLANNTAHSSAGSGFCGGAAGAGGTTSITSSIFWKNSDSAGQGVSSQLTTFIPYEPARPVNCNISGFPLGLDAKGNSGDDPLLYSPLGFDGVAGTEDDDPELAIGSPCIDFGGAMTMPSDTDAAGRSRSFDVVSITRPGENSSPASHVDRGAFEYRGDPGCIRAHLVSSLQTPVGTPDLRVLLFSFGSPSGSAVDGHAYGTLDLAFILQHWGCTVP